MTAARPWREVWSAPDERLTVQARSEDGWIRHRTVSNSEGDGAVAVVLNGARVLLVKVERAAINRTLWELPRGQADEADGSPVATAARELLEETGWVATDPQLIGKIWPDSGLTGDAVNVVVMRANNRADTAHAKYPEQRWVEVDRLSEEIAAGHIRDGISLAALTLTWSKDAFAEPGDG